MHVNFLGDIHGKINFDKEKFPIIQVGDFNLGGYTHWYRAFENPIWFIDGNHDNFPMLNMDLVEQQVVADNVIYIPRGYVSGKVLFIGGTESIDKNFRIPGYDWYPEETLTNNQFERIKKITTEIEVVVTHDCPDFVFRDLTGLPENSETRIKLGKLFGHFMPKLWIFGHHHDSISMDKHSCKFIGLNIDEMIEIDIPLNPNDFKKESVKQY